MLEEKITNKKNGNTPCFTKPGPPLRYSGTASPNYPWFLAEMIVIHLSTDCECKVWVTVMRPRTSVHRKLYTLYQYIVVKNYRRFCCFFVFVCCTSYSLRYEHELGPSICSVTSVGLIIKVVCNGHICSKRNTYSTRSLHYRFVMFYIQKATLS